MTPGVYGGQKKVRRTSMPKMKLTAQAVKGLPAPESGRVDYQDELVPGLVLRVSAAGTKSYSVSYWKNGRRPRVTLGDASVLKLADAREKARDILRDVKIGIDPAADKREERGAITFAKLAREYVERWAKVRKAPKGAREDQLRIEKVLIARWGSLKAHEVRKRDVVKLLDEYADAGKPYARNRMQALVSKIYNFGIKRDAVDVNPAKGIDREPEEPRKRVLSDDELKIVLPLFDKEGMAGLGFRLLLLTGQRPTEVFGMRWSEIEGDVWMLPKERTKNRNSKYAPDFHLVPLSTQARAVLRDLKLFDNDGGYVFPSPARKDATKQSTRPFLGYQKAARRVKDAAELDGDWNIYDLKSTCLTGLERLGFPGAVVSAVANHLPTSVTRQHYSFHDFADEKRKALGKWGKHVAKIDPTTKADVVELRR